MAVDIGTAGNADPPAALRGRLLIVLGALSACGPATTGVYLPSLPANPDAAERSRILR